MRIKLSHESSLRSMCLMFLFCLLLSSGQRKIFFGSTGLCVCLSVRNMKQKVMDGLQIHLMEWSGEVTGTGD